MFSSLFLGGEGRGGGGVVGGESLYHLCNKLQGTDFVSFHAKSTL